MGRGSPAGIHRIKRVGTRSPDASWSGKGSVHLGDRAGEPPNDITVLWGRAPKSTVVAVTTNSPTVARAVTAPEFSFVQPMNSAQSMKLPTYSRLSQTIAQHSAPLQEANPNQGCQVLVAVAAPLFLHERHPVSGRKGLARFPPLLLFGTSASVADMARS